MMLVAPVKKEWQQTAAVSMGDEMKWRFSWEIQQDRALLHMIATVLLGKRERKAKHKPCRMGKKIKLVAQ